MTFSAGIHGCCTVLTVHVMLLNTPQQVHVCLTTSLPPFVSGFSSLLARAIILNMNDL